MNRSISVNVLRIWHFIKWHPFRRRKMHPFRQCQAKKIKSDFCYNFFSYIWKELFFYQNFPFKPCQIEIIRRFNDKMRFKYLFAGKFSTANRQIYKSTHSARMSQLAILVMPMPINATAQRTWRHYLSCFSRAYIATLT